MFKLRSFKFAITQCRHHYKRANVIKAKTSKPSIEHIGEPLITCKRPEFNLHRGDHVPVDAPFGSIPLASDGWHHYKAKNDFFIFHPHVSGEIDTQSDEFAHPFEKFDLYPDLIDNLKNRLSIEKTTFIQHKAIPQMMMKDHTLIAAETGCGKTIAYLLPIIQHVLKWKRTNSYPREFNTPLVLILTPGRELALQIGQVAEHLCHNLDVKAKVLVGGKTKREMQNPSVDDVDVLVGSLGVISKLITAEVYRMHEVRHVVLDEADTLLDDSFIGKLSYVLKRFPFYKNTRKADTNEVSTQLVLASATMPTNIEESLKVIIDTSTLSEVSSPNLHKILPSIRQKFLRTRKAHRPIELLSLVKPALEKKQPIIVFSNKRATSDYISILLNDSGIDAVSLNNAHLEKIREAQFEKFQTGQVNVLSTTDLASRGLDTRRACHVVNFDFPNHISDYIHRCGRIGRVNSASNCLVTNFITGLNEIKLVKQIEHTARTKGILPNVDANIHRIITNNIIREMKKEDKEILV